MHGFASQALIKTSANRYFGESDKTSLDFSEIGVNASLRLRPRLLLAGQLLARRAGEMYEGDLSLDYGLIDLILSSSSERRVGLRAGRLKNPLGLYNETRDVPFTRPSIFLPQVVYFDKVRNLVLSTDGLMLYAEGYGELGTLSMVLGGGRAVIDENVEWAYLQGDWPGDIESDGATWLWSLWYASVGERFRLGFSGAALSIGFDPDPHASRNLAGGETEILYWIASLQYNAEDWTLSAELVREPLEWRGYGPVFGDRTHTAEGYYLQGTYRLRSSVELVLRYEEGFSNRSDRDGREAERRSGGSIPAAKGYSKILTAGLRWDIGRHWMVCAEYQRHDGTFILSDRENPDPGRLDPHWDLFAMQIAVRF